jgi:hypothetical protein
LSAGLDFGPDIREGTTMKKKRKPYYDPTPFFKKLEKDLTPFEKSLREGLKFAQGKKAKVKVEELLIRTTSPKMAGMDKGKLLYRSGKWKIYKPGPKTKQELERAIKKVKSGKSHYKKLEL